MTIDRDDLATRVSDVACVIQEACDYFVTAPAAESRLKTELPWLRLDRLIHELFDANAFRDHATALHDEIRRARFRADDPANIALVPWDEAVTYFTHLAGVHIASGRDLVGGNYPEARWLPGMPAVIKGLQDLATLIRDTTARLPPINDKQIHQSPSGRVKLRGREAKPIVDGQEQATLTLAQYDVVEALIDAGAAGLSKHDLDRKSRHGAARKTLKRLATTQPAWMPVIQFAETPGKGYRII